MLKSTIWRALALLAVAMVAFAVVAALSDARSEPVGLRMVADCWPAETAMTVLTGRGLLLRDAWEDDYGQSRERWEASGGAPWVEVMLGEGPGGAGRCIVAGSRSLPGEPS